MAVKRKSKGDRLKDSSWIIITKAVVVGAISLAVHLMLEKFLPDTSTVDGYVVVALSIVMVSLVVDGLALGQNLEEIEDAEEEDEDDEPEEEVVVKKPAKEKKVTETPKKEKKEDKTPGPDLKAELKKVFSKPKPPVTVKAVIAEQPTKVKTMPLASQDSKTTVVMPKIESQDISAAQPWSYFDNAKLGMILIKPDGDIAYCNELAKPFLDKNDQITLFTENDEDINFWIKQSRDNKLSNYHLWEKAFGPDSTQEDRRFYDVAINFRKDEAIETIVMIIDRTELYAVDEEDFNFIAFATHELRGPITVIRGYLEILEEELRPSVESDYQQIFDRLAVSANRLSTYINNILSVSKYDRKHLQVYIHEETIGNVIDLVLDDLKLRAATQGRLLSFDIPDNLPTIAADKASLSEVLVNLVDNAIKYSREGGSIEVSAEQKGEFVEIKVTDYGIGMPSNVVNNLFKKFYRSHRSREAVAGTGIGLYLSKAIIDSHGGYIGVISEVGKGSTFTFSVPIYATVAERLKEVDGMNQALIRQQADGWIKNHGLYKS